MRKSHGNAFTVFPALLLCSSLLRKKDGVIALSLLMETDPVGVTLSIEKSRGTIMSVIATAADQDRAECDYRAAIACWNGQGVYQDLRMAFIFFCSAAQQGHATATRCVAICLRDGIGVEKDEDYANRVFARASAEINPMWLCEGPTR
jgi:hypothetical protein